MTEIEYIKEAERALSEFEDLLKITDLPKSIIPPVLRESELSRVKNSLKINSENLSSLNALRPVTVIFRALTELYGDVITIGFIKENPLEMEIIDRLHCLKALYDGAVILYSKL